MLRIGVLGCGRIGRVHAASIMRLPDAALVAVSDAFAQNALDLATQTGAQVRSSDAIIESDDIDAIIICTPTDTHYDLIHAAAKARKAIFCEKPVDMSADRIRDCIKVVEAYAVALMTAFNRRFDPNFASVHARIQAGEIGNVELVTILSRDPAPPPISYIKTSGGIFRDMMIHDFDMARFLMGEDPVQVFATGSALVEPEIGAAGDVDTAAVILTTASGKICQISNSRRASYGYDQRIEVHGAAGLLRAQNVLEDTVEVGNAAGFRRAPTMNFFLERYERAYLAEMAHFVAAVTAGTPLSSTITDGLQAQLMADAATLSLAEGRPITI
ncbi:inositol 2-dehydrogenase [Loktanella salsilacus]|uniref:inositol 2-dehydrogenase n=1 Tax=Loktanella salsilacus TaxID=195913 RepID=UPI0020B7EA83|nr:inositol 2-dehydrogenase [Loktanella salsilacus]UTH45779.1 inositol 2-dehydrogenase [Loktanella salsilacus]